jgi:hypothetical protein
MAADDLLIPAGIILLVILMSGSGDKSRREEEEEPYDDYKYPRRVEFGQSKERGFYSNFQDIKSVYEGTQYTMTIHGGSQSEATYQQSMENAEKAANVTNAFLNQVDEQVNRMSQSVQLLNEANVAARQAQDTESFERLREIKNFLFNTFVDKNPLWEQYFKELNFRKHSINDNFDNENWKFESDLYAMGQAERASCLKRIERMENELARIKDVVEQELEDARTQIDEWGLHQNYSQSYEMIENTAYTHTPMQSNTYPTQPDFNSAPPAQDSYKESRQRRDAFDDRTYAIAHRHCGANRPPN